MHHFQLVLRLENTLPEISFQGYRNTQLLFEMDIEKTARKYELLCLKWILIYISQATV